VITLEPIALEEPRLLEAQPILRATGLNKRYETSNGTIQALQDVSLHAYPGEVLGIVGESGSGKSTVLRLLNLEEHADAGSYTLDAPDLEGKDLFALNRFERRAMRVQHIGMRSTSSGNVAERLILAGERNFAILRRSARVSLEASEFPIGRMDEWPARLSGGMQQRVQLAKAIALEPTLLLLDEPTTGLDVSVQALVLDTLKRLQFQYTMTMVLVSHDLGVIRTLADRVMVMRAGRVVESGLTDQVLEDPQHPYTQQLVHAKL
jgi:putative phosphonate transport system ATP-binding protein